MQSHIHKKKTIALSFSFPCSCFLCQLASFPPSPPGDLCLDTKETSRANMGKALSCLCMVNVSAERVISPALPNTPTYSLASGSQSADLYCWGDLVFHVGYLKSINTSHSLYLFSLLHSLTFLLSCALVLLQPYYIHPFPCIAPCTPFPQPLPFNLSSSLLRRALVSKAAFIPSTVSPSQSSACMQVQSKARWRPYIASEMNWSQFQTENPGWCLHIFLMGR